MKRSSSWNPLGIAGLLAGAAAAGYVAYRYGKDQFEDPWNTPGFLIDPKFTRDGATPADLVILSARVLVCDDAGTRAQAVAVRDGRFVFVGDNRAARAFIGSQTRVLNARGRMLTPGFVDTHVHLLWVSMLRPFLLDLYDCHGRAEVIAQVKSFAAEHPDLPLILAIGWRYEDIGMYPAVADLDAALPDRPAWLLSYDAMVSWPNSLMARIMAERNPRACRRMHPHIDPATGKPSGLLLHSHSFDPFEFFKLEDFPAGTKEKMLASMREAVDRAVAVGVTTFDELQVYDSALPLMLELRDRGGLDHARARLTWYVDPIDLEDEAKLIADLERFKKLGARESGEHLITGQSLKLYIDGCFGNHTSFMFDPFSDAPGEYGDAVWTQESFDRLMEIIDQLGLQACTHAIGDAGIQRAINSYVHARAKNGGRDARHRIEHCELPLGEDIARMAANGIQAGMQPTQFYGDESFERTLGLERLRRFHPWRRLRQAGVTLSFGTDWIAGPTLPPINPVYGLMIAATRMNYHGETNWAPDEALSLEEAIRCYTLGGARALFLEDRIGSIETGKLADCVLFNQNLLKLKSWWFLLTHDFEVGKLDDLVELVLVDGKPAYTRPKSDLG